MRDALQKPLLSPLPLPHSISHGPAPSGGAIAPFSSATARAYASRKQVRGQQHAPAFTRPPQAGRHGRGHAGQQPSSAPRPDRKQGVSEVGRGRGMSREVMMRNGEGEEVLLFYLRSLPAPTRADTKKHHRPPRLATLLLPHTQAHTPAAQKPHTQNPSQSLLDDLDDVLVLQDVLLADALGTVAGGRAPDERPLELLHHGPVDAVGKVLHGRAVRPGQDDGVIPVGQLALGLGVNAGQGQPFPHRLHQAVQVPLQVRAHGDVVRQAGHDVQLLQRDLIDLERERE